MTTEQHAPISVDEMAQAFEEFGYRKADWEAIKAIQ